MYEEMVKNNQLQEFEVIALNYRIQTMTSDPKFASQSLGLKASYSKLKSKIAPHALKITTSLVNDIAKGDFKRPNAVFEVQKNFQKGKDLFLAELVKLYLSSTNLMQFVQMYKYIENLQSYKSVCYMYAILWQELRARGSGGTMELLVVWVRASEISQLLKKGNETDAQCKSVANSSAPIYKETLASSPPITDYKNFIKNGQLKNIQELHKKIRMAFFFADYISSLTWGALQNAKFNKLVEAINALPSFYDTCTVAAAVYERLKRSEMRGTFEHLQALQIVKKTRSKPNYTTNWTNSPSPGATASTRTFLPCSKRFSMETLPIASF